MADAKRLAATLLGVVREWVEPAVTVIVSRMDALERRFAALPTPQNGKDADPEVIRAEVQKAVGDAVAALPVPKDGADADPEEVARLVAEAVLKIPPPEDGKSVTLDEVRPMVASYVAEAVAALPVPKDGQSVTLQDVEPLVAAAVETAVAAIPAPKDGRDATPEDMQPLIEAAALRAVSALPVPKDGADADPEVVRSMVADAVAQLPPPKPGEPGKDVDMAEVRRMVDASVAEAVAALPPPENGKDADPLEPEAVRGIVRQEVEQAVAALPKPENGKDADPIHPDTIARMVLEQVQVAVAAIPRARDGEDGRDAAELNVLPSIDETKSYPRGTWASHRGGLIRASRATDPVTAGLPLAGWVVITEGLATAPVVMQSDDLREVSITCELTSGVSGVTKFSMPVLLDRGVWREGDYDAGDGVTWDGSFWIAQRTTRDKPGTSDAFRLAVKRGRDAKNTSSASIPASASGPVTFK